MDINLFASANPEVPEVEAPKVDYVVAEDGTVYPRSPRPKWALIPLGLVYLDRRQAQRNQAPVEHYRRVMIDQSRYPAEVLRRLRRERGVGSRRILDARREG